MSRLTREQLAEYSGPDAVISSFELQEVLKQRKSGGDYFRIDSGIPSLDSKVDGFRGGELVVISGPTGQGKTLLLQSMTAQFAKADQEPLWFTFEVPAGQFLASFPELPYFLLPAELKSGSLEWFRDRCVESSAKHGNRIVIIDHLHFLADFFKLKNPSLELGQIVRRLKRFAVSEGFVIFLICHIGKIPDGTKARSSNIRDSSFICQEADTVLMVQRLIEGEAKNRAILTVEKARRTGVFGETVNLQKIGGYLRELVLMEGGR
jgi:KaiC/GvpD/RAD55 family RecA-like ATPase